MKKRVISLLLVFSLLFSSCVCLNISTASADIEKPSDKIDLGVIPLNDFGKVNLPMIPNVDRALKQVLCTFANNTQKDVVFKFSTITDINDATRAPSTAPTLVLESGADRKTVKLWSEANGKLSGNEAAAEVLIKKGENASMQVELNADTWLSGVNINILSSYEVTEYKEEPTATPMPTNTPNNNPGTTTPPGGNDPGSTTPPGGNNPSSPTPDEVKVGKISSVKITPKSLTTIAISVYADYGFDTEFTGVILYRDGKKIATLKKDFYSANVGITDKNLKANTKYAYKVVPYAEKNGKIYEGTPVTSYGKTMSVKKVKYLNVTKLSKKVANITFKPADDNLYPKETKFLVYAGKKLIKSITNSGKSIYIFQNTKGKATKSSYKVVTVAASNKKLKATSKTKKPVSNKKTFKYRYIKAPAQYKVMDENWRPSSLSYNGKKLKCKGFFVNSHILKLSQITFQVSIIYYSPDGKQVLLGKKTVKSGKIKENSTKNCAFTIKAKKTVDVKNGGTIGLTWMKHSYKY